MANYEVNDVSIATFKVIYDNLDVFNIICKVSKTPYTARFVITPVLTKVKWRWSG